MSLTVTQRPSQTVSGETSKWNAVNNPILYKFQREDFTFNQINNDAGDIQVQINGVDYTSSFIVGDSVYVQSDNSVYDLSSTITDSQYSGGNTLITIDSSYVSAAPGGFINNNTLRSMYRVEVAVYDNSDDSLISTVNYAPDSTGLVKANVSTSLKSVLLPDQEAVLTGSTETFEDTNFIAFYIKYTEVWSESAESQTDDQANVFYAVLGSMQIPSLYGGNMGLYVMWEDGNPDGLFLTKLTKPVMWRGYPFLITAIISDNTWSDVYLVSNNNTTPADYQGKIVNFDLNQIITDQTVEELTIEVYTNDSPDRQISETLTIELRDACENPILLMARNSLGGVLEWMFDNSQEYTFDYGDGRKAKRLVLFAEVLSINQWESLQDFITLGEVYKDNIVEFDSSVIKTSTRVDQQVYVVNSDGTKIGVIVIPTKNKTETRQSKHNFELEIEYPELF